MTANAHPQTNALIFGVTFCHFSGMVNPAIPLALVTSIHGVAMERCLGTIAHK